MKTFIGNRSGIKLCVVVEGPHQKGNLAFVMHGLGGTKDGAEVRAIITALLDLHYTVVSFDAAHTVGESEGNYEDASVTNYYGDLEDVIAWASGQPWYVEPFVLCGHSLGGLCAALFAEKYPDKVRGLAPIATVVSGKLSEETYDGTFREAGELEEWRRTGWQVRQSRDGKELRLKWSHMEDRLKYDLLPGVNKLTMPTLLVVGSRDRGTPLKHQRILLNKLPAPKKLHVISGAGHVFREKHEQTELHDRVKAWAAKL